MRPEFLFILGLAIAIAYATKRGFEEGYSEELPSMASDNVMAFLALIRRAESRDNYRALVGGGEFNDFSDHPAITGEWPGIRRGDDGRLTTAAGAYQITRTTWNDLGGSGRYGDFLPQSQDQAAVDLIKRRGALTDIEAGNFDVAVSKLRNEWEAFARMIAGNYHISLAQARDIYASNGGTFA